MKQSLKLNLPILNDSVKFSEVLNYTKEPQKFIAHCAAGNRSHIFEITQKLSTLTLIGPEGDFTREEIHAAEQKGFVPVSLGKSRLRTETAGVVACSFLNLKLKG
jgi:16S rRNA (uracil1498-N3)-methyltransferase